MNAYVPQHASFSMGQVFPATDLVARWVVGLSINLSDCSVANRFIERPSPRPEDFLYFIRLAGLQLYEANEYINRYEKQPPIKKFMGTLSPQAQGYLADARTAYTTLGEDLKRLRNSTAHVPRMADVAAPRDALVTTALGVVSGRSSWMLESARIEDAYLGFAWDTLREIIRGRPKPGPVSAKDPVMERLIRSIHDGYRSLMAYMKEAIKQYLHNRMALITLRPAVPSDYQ